VRGAAALLGAGPDFELLLLLEDAERDLRFNALVRGAVTRIGRTLLLWRRALAHTAANLPVDYPDPAGHEPLRKALAASLREQRGVIANPDDVLIVSGSQQALDITSRVLCDEGVAVAIEDPHYQGMRQVFLAAGARLVPCPVDAHGLDIDRHEERLRDVRAICVTPSHQFPTGAIMSIERRLKLLQWCTRHDVWLVEDDYDCEFRHGVSQIPALQGLDTNGRVLYIGSFARTLFPGLRLGYIAAPPALRNTLRAVKWLADRGSSTVDQRTLARFIESGDYESSRRRMARRLAEKGKRLFAALRAHFDDSEVMVWGSASGIHQFVQLEKVKAVDGDALIEHSYRHGVRVYSGQPYHLLPPRTVTLVLGYARVLLEDIDLGIRRLAKAYRSFRR
jgi:GntR family transcriptional regulator / MocR family aminotransferase